MGTNTSATMVEALIAGGPEAGDADRLMLFGQFVGAWDLDWRGRAYDGHHIVVRGELHFAWVLGGRAVQDVWRVPIDPADAHRMRGFHGTTIRFYDPTIGAWRSTWLDPVNGRIRRFIGRPTAAGIVLDSLDDDPLERWSFLDITTGSFRWISEESTDGLAWVRSEEMYARRCPTKQITGGRGRAALDG